MEYLIGETVKDRKKEKKNRERQMNTMLKALSEKPQLAKDIPTLSYCKI